jgi:hypothetical protein
MNEFEKIKLEKQSRCGICSKEFPQDGSSFYVTIIGEDYYHKECVEREGRLHNARMNKMFFCIPIPKELLKETEDES